MTMQIKKAVIAINCKYDVVLKKLHLYCDMKLVTFDIYDDSDLIIQFSVFVQPYSQNPLTFYQTELVPVHIKD